MHASLDDLRQPLDQHGCSPFLPDNETAYQAWRRRKLALRAELRPGRVFRLDDELSLPAVALADAARQVEAFNFLLFETPRPLGKPDLLALGRQFGLRRLDDNPGADADRVTSLRVVDEGDPRARYIPYSNRALNWHTDGYYNDWSRPIRAFALYCVHQAGRGGGNMLFDHEWMYLTIRDQAPELLCELMAPDMLRIPANIQDGRVLRGEESGPVFAPGADGGGLVMRYTSRPRNIVWKGGERSAAALDLLRRTLVGGEGAIEIRLRDGQGLISNNLLHGRQAFFDEEDAPPRLVYRARYLEPISLAAEAA